MKTDSSRKIRFFTDSTAEPIAFELHSFFYAWKKTIIAQCQFFEFFIFHMYSELMLMAPREDLASLFIDWIGLTSLNL